MSQNDYQKVTELSVLMRLNTVFFKTNNSKCFIINYISDIKKEVNTNVKSIVETVSFETKCMTIALFVHRMKSVYTVYCQYVCTQ